MEYPKIETLFDRDKDTFKVDTSKWRLPEFEYLQNNEWLVTEKIDGTNIRVMWDGQKVVFGGRTDNANLSASLVTRLQELFPVEKFQLNYPNVSMTLYGEGYGAGIQKGGGNYLPDGKDFILFDVLIKDYWLLQDDMNGIASKLQIKTVPFLGKYNLNVVTNMVKLGLVSTFGSFKAEGVVVKTPVGLYSRYNQRLVGKLKATDL
ncbi:hypothetical protein HYS94_02030 [Candidatus Daviesbacteria bacterium]|nr:hypothetical protein [Candidatus Daviesbacteria bacterium]